MACTQLPDSTTSKDLDRNPSSGREGSNDSDNTGYPTMASSTQSLTGGPSIAKIGVDETLWNPDRTRYGGYLLPPKEVLRQDTTSDSNFRKVLSDWLAKKDGPLTPEEQAQKERRLKAFGGRNGTPLDPALVDEAMEWL